jgi:hypothetical protein
MAAILRPFSSLWLRAVEALCILEAQAELEKMDSKGDAYCLPKKADRILANDLEIITPYCSRCQHARIKLPLRGGSANRKKPN